MGKVLKIRKRLLAPWEPMSGHGLPRQQPMGAGGVLYHGVILEGHGVPVGVYVR